MFVGKYEINHTEMQNPRQSASATSLAKKDPRQSMDPKNLADLRPQAD